MVRLLGVVLLVLGAGCAAFTDIAGEKDEGTARRYPVTADQAWDISKTVLRWDGAKTLVDHRAEGYILASNSEDTRDYVTAMAVWLERDPDGVMRVTARARGRLVLNPATLFMEDTFHRRFALAVRMVQEGKPLPEQPPD